MRHLGFASAVCYRLSGEALVQVLSTETGEGAEVAWPAAANFSYHSDDYTRLGWMKPTSAGGTGSSASRLWPKGASFYVPDQELHDDKIVFAVVAAAGKRLKTGELNGVLEAAAARIRGWFRDQSDRLALSEAGVREHLERLGVDLRMLIDHELRTPMASIAGYVSLLGEIDPTQSEVWAESFRILTVETGNALEAIDKLSLALHADRGFEAKAMRVFDAADEVRRLCERTKDRAYELVGEDGAKKTRVQFYKATDQSCALEADLSLFNWALWEVLKNAVTHSRSGKVGVSVYTSDKMLVIDVEDDGSGVSPGSEELIFLRFYQDPGTQHLRRGKRGLGLGLFLARHIAERHLGQLTFIRQRGTSLFRFVWPLPKEDAPVLHFPKGA